MDTTTTPTPEIDEQLQREMDYRVNLDRWTRLPAYDREPAERYDEEFFNLDRFQKFLNRVGNPEKGLPVIHLAGSKGKGSTAALIAAGLQALGKRVGVFMSPYLNEPRESIFVDGQPMDEHSFTTLSRYYFETLDQLKPDEQITSFEMLTAMALQHFHDRDVDFAVIETGLGGRLDATNIVESPILSIITPVEKEHTDLLGDSITSVAYEKLGIVREETPVIVAHQDSYILEFARSVCFQKQSPCTTITGNYVVSVLDRSHEGYSFKLKTPSRTIDQIKIALRGDHQINNAITAWAALDELMPDFPPQPVLDVWGYLNLPARFQTQIIQGNEVILDGAHTLQSSKALRRTLDDLYPSEPITFVLGFLSDKEVGGILRNLVKSGDTVVLTQINHPRALPARQAGERLFTSVKTDRITHSITNNSRIALQKAFKMSPNQPIVIAGSFKLIEELQRQ